MVTVSTRRWSTNTCDLQHLSTTQLCGWVESEECACVGRATCYISCAVGQLDWSKLYCPWLIPWSSWSLFTLSFSLNTHVYLCIHYKHLFTFVLFTFVWHCNILYNTMWSDPWVTILTTSTNGIQPIIIKGQNCPFQTVLVVVSLVVIS